MWMCLWTGRGPKRRRPEEVVTPRHCFVVHERVAVVACLEHGLFLSHPCPSRFASKHQSRHSVVFARPSLLVMPSSASPSPLIVHCSSPLLVCFCARCTNNIRGVPPNDGHTSFDTTTANTTNPKQLRKAGRRLARRGEQTPGGVFSRHGSVRGHPDRRQHPPGERASLSTRRALVYKTNK